MQKSADGSAVKKVKAVPKSQSSDGGGDDFPQGVKMMPVYTPVRCKSKEEPKSRSTPASSSVLPDSGRADGFPAPAVFG